MEVLPQALALPGRGAWVYHNTIRELGVPSSSSGSVPSIGHILLYTGEDNGSFRLLPFPSQSWSCGP